MSKIPENIKAILRDEGVSAQCYKRLKDAWPSLPEQEIADARKDLLAAKKSLDRFQDVRVIEVRTVPEGCVTLEDAERAMIMAATQEAMSMKDILAAARKLDMGKTTLYRKLRKYGLSRVDDNQAVNSSMLLKERIKRLRAEADRLEKLLLAETVSNVELEEL